MHLSVLSRYSRGGASSRLRTLQYRPWLEEAGIRVTYTPFFDDEYLARIYSRASSLTALPGYFGRRILSMRRGPKPDLYWIEKEVFPWLPWMIERRLLPGTIPYVSDYDDAVFHRYDRHRSKAVRWLLSEKIDRIMASSMTVTAGNAYLATRARSAGAKQVDIVPTVVDLRNYAVAGKPSSDRHLTVGWIGTPQTWAEFARPLHDVVLPTLRQHDARFRAVGASLLHGSEERLDIVPWSESSEVQQIQSMDVGVMPLPDTPWTRGKCGYKLIQYMACGLPVVASPIEVNTEIVQHGVNGFLAETDQEWQQALSALLCDSDLRARFGRAGRRIVEERFSLQQWGPRMAGILRSAAGV